MTYKPQPGQRKHKQLIGDSIAETDWLIDDLQTLARAAKNAATQLHIARMEIRARTIQLNLYNMLEIVRGETQGQ